MSDGASGTIKSTTPPMTPLAWTSIATGVAPGKHGIYDFREQDTETYEVTSTDYSSMYRPTVWDIFNAYDLDVGIVNYPVAYPPESVDSFFISGFPAPDDERLASPPHVQTYIDSVDYRTKPRRKPEDNPVAYYEEIKDITDIRCEVTIELANQYDVDLLWPVFMGIDWVQHYLWNQEINGLNAVDRFYEYIDGIVGRLVDEVEDGTNVLLVSDHGFRPLIGEVHLNSLLEDRGYLSRKYPDISTTDKLTTALGGGVWTLGAALPFSIKHKLKQLLPEQLLNWMRNGAGVNSDFHDQIDWAKTKAFSYGSMGRIFIHTEFRYPEGPVSEQGYEEIRQQLRNELTSLQSPITDENVFEEILLGESVYGEDAIGVVPDLLAIPSRWEYMIYSDFDKNWIHKPHRRVADHDPEGMIVAFGDEIKDENLSVFTNDVASLLLYWHDLPLPKDSGTGLLSQAIGSSAEIEQIPPKEINVSERRASTSQINEEVARRLDDLGYT